MRLISYARARGLAYGWRRRTIAWVLDLTTPAAPRWVGHGQDEHVPYARRSGTGARPRPGCDTVSYLTGKHASAWREATVEATALSDHPAAVALRACLDLGALPDPPATANPNDLAGVHADGEWLHNDPALASWWSSHLRGGLDSGRDGMCLCCMAAGRLARLIPAYLPPHRLGVHGSGDLALYPTPKRGDSAYRSDGLMCLDCAMGIGAAVASLTEDPAHHHTLASGGGALLWWDPSGAAPVPLGPLLNEPSREALAAAPRNGRVCALLLTANGPGRITISSHWDIDALQAVERVAAWYERIAVDETWSGGETISSPAGLHYVATHRWDRNSESFLPTQRATRLSEAELWRAVLEGCAPWRHIRATHKAIQGDNRMLTGRVALLQLQLGENP